MKIIITLFISIMFVSFNQQSSVFICKGPSSKVYHRSSRCKGLSNCSTSVYQINLDDAKRMGRRACRIEY